MKFFVIFLSITLVQAREHWWFSTHGYNKAANADTSTPAHEPPNQEAQQVQSILVNANDTEFNNETSTPPTVNVSSTTHHEPIIINSKREAPVDQAPTTSASSTTTQSSVIIVASKRDDANVESPNETVSGTPPTIDNLLVVKRESPNENMAKDTSTMTTVHSEPIIVASKRDATAQNEEVIEDNIAEGNATHSYVESLSSTTSEDEAVSETEDVDKRKRDAEECPTEPNGQSENVIEEIASDANAEYEKPNHPFARVRRVSKAGSSHKIRNEKPEQNNPYFKHTTQSASDEDDSDESE